MLSEVAVACPSYDGFMCSCCDSFVPPAAKAALQKFTQSKETTQREKYLLKSIKVRFTYGIYHFKTLIKCEFKF